MSVYPPVTSESSNPSLKARATRPIAAAPSRVLIAAVAVLAVVGILASISGGPTLGDHEAIVAQCARNMRISSDWIVPDFLGTPFFRKPPLPYWLVASASYVFPKDALTGLPVATTSARFPSGLAALGTILLLWRLASAMFGPRTGLIAAVISTGSLVFLLYSPNATAEMPLTFCGTWAFFHFWFALTERDRRTTAGLSALRFRNIHIVLFYVAMGFGMLAKGPAPIVMTAMPLAVWWYTERPLRRVARGGIKALPDAAVSFFREFIPRTVQVFTQLWLLPGLVVFALLFVPWMLAVAARYPHAWDLWNWQYWQRAQGNYEDTRVRGPFYYLPVVVGLVVPWVFMLPEAAIAPWLKRYTKQRRGLLYAGLWALTAVAVMSLMQFKKPYYITPAIPALLLMIAVVAERFYTWVLPRGSTTLWLIPDRRSVVISNPRRLAWTILGALAIGSLAAVIGANFWLRKEMPEVASGLTLIAVFVAVMLLIASAYYIAGRGWVALALTSLTSIAAFNAVWHIYAPSLDNVAKVAALAKALDKAGVPADANVLWADSRPEARLEFYFNRKSTYMIKPEEIVTRMVDRTQSKQELQEFALQRAEELVNASKPVYIILDRRHYDGWSHYMSNMGHIIAEIPDDDKDDRSRDWLVISNVKPPAG